jgi:hypothetical protein
VKSLKKKCLSYLRKRIEMKSEVILIFFILNGLLIVSSESEFETTTLNPETTTEPITTEIATETTSELTTQTTEKSTTILVSKIAKLSAILSTTTTTTLSPPTTTTSAPSNFITSTIESLRKFFFCKFCFVYYFVMFK